MKIEENRRFSTPDLLKSDESKSGDTVSRASTRFLFGCA